MGRTLNEVVAGLPKARRRAVEKRAAELIAEELSLRDLRKALQLTQNDVAATLGKGQDEVSRIEQRGDLLLSTLQRYVRSLGGELELVCTFRDRSPVRIKTNAFAEAREPARRIAKARIAAAFPNSAAANDALKGLLKVARMTKVSRAPTGRVAPSKSAGRGSRKAG